MISITRFMRDHWHVTYNGRTLGVFDTYCQAAKYTTKIRIEPWP